MPCDEVRNIPQSILAALAEALEQNGYVAERQRREFTEVARFFNGQGLDVMPIKGMALDLTVYRKVCMERGDVDLLLRYSGGCAKEINPEQARNFFLGITSYFECEIHHHDVNLIGILPVDFDLIWSDASPGIFRG